MIPTADMTFIGVDSSLIHELFSDGYFGWKILRFGMKGGMSVKLQLQLKQAALFISRC